MEQFCMGCGGVVNVGAACPTPGQVGCVKGQTTVAPTPKKKPKKKGGR